MKFNFRLERVLNYKKTVEDLKKNQYGSVKQRLNREENKLDSFIKHKKNLLNEKDSTIVKTRVGNLVLYNNYIKDINEKIENQKEIVSQVEKELQIKRAEMIDAIKEKKMLEKLKENEYEKYLYELKKEEEKLNDTIVNFKVSTRQ
ncbi:MAG: flagellar export protein FliJ [Tissierellia bacterium]|nr:flagellar export protein FliJ [Tissierellia bacterium]